jgi:hypothetical protein
MPTQATIPRLARPSKLLNKGKGQGATSKAKVAKSKKNRSKP